MEKFSRKKLMDAVYKNISPEALRFDESKLRDILRDIAKIDGNNFSIFRMQLEKIFSGRISKWKSDHSDRCYDFSFQQADIAKVRYDMLKYVLEKSDDGLDNDGFDYEHIYNFINQEIKPLYSFRSLKEYFNSFVQERIYMIYAYFGLEVEEEDLEKEIESFSIEVRDITEKSDAYIIFENFADKHAKIILDKINKKNKNDNLEDYASAKEQTSNELDPKFVDQPIQGLESNEKTENNNAELLELSLDEKIVLIKDMVTKLEDLSRQEKELLSDLDIIKQRQQQLLDEISGLKK